MDVTYDEFMKMQIKNLSQRYEGMTKIERWQGITNHQINQFRLYFKRDVPEIILTISPNLELNDITFRLVDMWDK